MVRMQTTLVRAFAVALCSTLAASAGLAQSGSPEVVFQYTTFSVPGGVVLGIESINNNGDISGYYSDSAGDFRGFLLPNGGTLATLINPGDTGTPGYTEAYQISNSGTQAGQFYNDATATYSGFLYSGGTYTTYNVPGQPAQTTTGVLGVNIFGNICGFVFPPPYTASSAFVAASVHQHTPAIFTVEGSSTNECLSMNNLGDAVGVYVDAAGVDHGWIRTRMGAITTYDAPGASTVAAAAPCAGTVAGTVVLGINDAGAISGHFFDTSNNEHGFILEPNGVFYQIDYPGAYQTAGGGLNDKGTMVGHYADSSCNQYGYTVRP